MSTEEQELTQLDEPETLEEWQEAVNQAYAMSVLSYATRIGFLKGPPVDAERCLDHLRRGRQLGVLPRRGGIVEFIAWQLCLRDQLDSREIADLLYERLIVRY